MSFHKCGGNVGDNVTISLPPWVLTVAREEQLLYRDRHGQVSEDCLSLSADDAPVFPGTGGTTAMRTALICYRGFVACFARTCLEYLGGTVVEIQVGMGPCGELRYPSYSVSQGWCFPGVGLVMGHDPGMRRMLELETGMTDLPEDLPTKMNDSAEDAPIFRVPWRQLDGGKPFCQGAAKTFFEWYQKVLLDHGEAILLEAIAAVHEARMAPASEVANCLASSITMPKKVGFSAKIAGIHWLVQHPSRAAEACAGYNCCTTVTADAYADIAQMLARTARKSGCEISLNFTCLEMPTLPNDALSDPEDLVAQVRRACIRHNLPLCGENALAFDMNRDANEFKQMWKQIRSWSRGPDRMDRLTLLRLDQSVASNKDLSALRNFVQSL
jgi:beta-amylase